ncbi:hypothetical protein L6164_008188 [Bauhinia variegata]|uniref:Uncharacterized protein n=1 Tax=Bauhinia variegata TaxID=167791 RepID=A0ACB9PH35_BAUVA|nr:hypothetical protein L6164_008188 [Bauhinia variegata]
MKTVFLAFFFFFLFVFATADDTVLDTDGKPVINNGSQYNILPTLRGTGGGLTLTIVGKEKCPTAVGQAPSELSNGLPVRISSREETEIIKIGWRVGIEFMAVPRCSPKPSLWHVPMDSDYVKIGADERLRGSFSIERASSSEDVYKFIQCPSSPFSCKDLGIEFDKEGNGRLVRVNYNPFIFRFKKATRN